MGIIEAATALFASATGVPQFFEQRKAARRAEREQKEANRIAQAQAQVENARRRRRAIAQARIAQAANAASVGSNIQSSSALAGVQSGLATQLGANIAAQQQQINTQQGIFDANQRAADAIRTGQERVGALNAFAQAGTSAINFLGSGTLGSVGNTTSSFLQPTFNAQQQAISQGNTNFVL